MFVDPVFDGLRRATKLSSNSRGGTAVDHNLFDGRALKGHSEVVFYAWKVSEKRCLGNYKTLIDPKENSLNMPFLERIPSMLVSSNQHANNRRACFRQNDAVNRQAINRTGCDYKSTDSLACVR